MTPITVTTKANFRLGRKGRKHLQTGDTPSPPVEPGRVPRVAVWRSPYVSMDLSAKERLRTRQSLPASGTSHELESPDHEPAAPGPRYPRTRAILAADRAWQRADPGA